MLKTHHLILLTLLLAAGCQAKPEPQSLGKVRLGGRDYVVELATTAAHRYQGLSGRDPLPDGRGMLFVYPSPRMLTFCMRGCAAPIDIAFLDGDGRIVNQYTMMPEPGGGGAAMYESHLPAVYALEVAGGTFGRLGVRVGEKVELLDVPAPASAEEGM